MFLNIKPMSRKLCFHKRVINNDLFGRQAPYFIENFDLEKVTKEVQDTFFVN
ncbi:MULTISPECIES: acyl dehydratase [Bacillus]|uniref:acyl dehydratase n=1 Tax=Bacillus TaxID=1386 RepID=UPI000994BF10|nr:MULTISPECIES: acyl dehydratase [Bacillus]OOZ91141.1 acyl dehydratase [Bacillus cereus]UOB76952.1 acyl dehydratase [Bacillus sp. ZJS3]